VIRVQIGRIPLWCGATVLGGDEKVVRRTAGRPVESPCERDPLRMCVIEIGHK
jgi:hypothetical protein